MSRIIETLGPPPAWMMNAAKRTDSFFKKVQVNRSAGGNSSSGSGAAGDAAAATEAAAAGAHEYVLYTRQEFEAVNKCQVRVTIKKHKFSYACTVTTSTSPQIPQPLSTCHTVYLSQTEG